MQASDKNSCSPFENLSFKMIGLVLTVFFILVMFLKTTRCYIITDSVFILLVVFFAYVFASKITLLAKKYDKKKNVNRSDKV
jgi:Mn2+/Fe2+ NRAMP family transporter